MNKTILKRIEFLENKSRDRDIPEMIMIHYDWKMEQFCICEMYCDKKTKRKIKNEVHFYDHYRDYEIPAAYDGTVIIDLIDVPEIFAGDLHVFKAGKIRRELNVSNCGLKFEHLRHVEPKWSEFAFTAVKRS